ncbi:hypothetical protein GCM10010339_57930 [Streptomyces alanosinicus]|uniref:Transposase IS110-like N-terminal domain-containing protein n=1 Tax=Streptomyces alanosinicus TaxID=68171 RepID=A0A918YML0_9ACTN|nr:hypothetical protein GCM10010339_57930 [Streptomyces alanosinicus]
MESTALQEWDEIAVDLRILTARRYDLSADRTRAINRLRAQLLEYFPALERAFDYNTSKAALTLLAGYQTLPACGAWASHGSPPGWPTARSAMRPPSRPQRSKPRTCNTPRYPARRRPRPWHAR